MDRSPLALHHCELIIAGFYLEIGGKEVGVGGEGGS